MAVVKKPKTDAEIRISKTSRFFGSKNLLVYTPSSPQGGFVVVPVKSFDNARVYIEEKDGAFSIRSSASTEVLATVSSRDEAEAIVRKISEAISPRMGRKILIGTGIVIALFVVLNIPMNFGSGDVSNSQLIVPKASNSSSIVPPSSVAPVVSEKTNMSDPFGLKVIPSDDNSSTAPAK